MSDSKIVKIKGRKPYNTKTLKFKSNTPLEKVTLPEIDYKLIGGRIR